MSPANIVALVVEGGDRSNRNWRDTICMYIGGVSSSTGTH